VAAVAAAEAGRQGDTIKSLIWLETGGIDRGWFCGAKPAKDNAISTMFKYIRQGK